MRPKKEARELIPFNNLAAIVILILIASTLTASYITYRNTQKIVQELTGAAPAEEDEARARICVNRPPTISQSCSSNAYVNYSYYCAISYHDADNDTLQFSDNTTLFDIDINTGEIIFTPNITDIGNYSIMITADDGSGCANPNATTDFLLYVKNESPPSPPPPGPPGVGGGGGGGVPRECQPQWECTPWSSCSPSGIQNRRCYTINNCLRDKPHEQQRCIYLLPPVPRLPREKEFFFCNFDEVEACTANFGPNEDWLYQYKGRVGVINVYDITSAGGGVLIDDTISFFAQISWIRSVDVDFDDVMDLEFISHAVADGRMTMTGRLIPQLESVREQPRYIEMLPWFIAESAYFADEHACAILVMMVVLVALLVYLLLIAVIEKKEKKEKK